MKEKISPPISTFAIYRSFFYGFPHLLWYLPLAFIILPLMFFWERKILFPEMILSVFGLMLVPVVLEIGRFLYVVFTYISFRRWKEELPFSLEGWEELTHIEHFPSPFYWQLKVLVAIECGPMEMETVKKMEESLQKFVRKTRPAFYTPNESLSGFANDPREQWQIEPHAFTQVLFQADHTVRMAGSLNCKVAYSLYKLMQKDLGSFNSHGGKIKKISILSASKNYYIQPLRGESESTAS